MGRIFAIGGGELPELRPLHRALADMVPREDRRLLFLGTASHDAEGYFDAIRREFEPYSFDARALCLSVDGVDDAEIDSALSWAGLIYVGGGDTLYLKDRWRHYGLGEKLTAVYRRDGAVLSGISAGAMCWFACGFSESEAFGENGGSGFGWVEGLLNLVPLALCPHYEERTEAFDMKIGETSLDGLALESGTAYAESNGSAEILTITPSAHAFSFSVRDGKRIKTRLDARVLTDEIL